MAATPSIVVQKTMTYRGVPRVWSNRYHFNGGTPADTAHWTTFSDAVVTAEKACLLPYVQITKTLGYAAGNNVPVFTKSYSTNGTLANPILFQAGDVAAIVRYATTARTSKNHPIYLFNYYHGVGAQTGPPADTLYTAQGTALGTYAGIWIGAGFSDGTQAYNRAGPNGATATGLVVEAFLSHSDFPR